MSFWKVLILGCLLGFSMDVASEAPPTDFKALSKEARTMQRSLDKPRQVPFALETTSREIKGRRAADILTWVRSNIEFQPYDGELRGARGVLIDRAGNSVDQAILLNELFRMRGFTTRFVRGKLSDSQVSELLERVAGQASLINPRNLDGEPVVHDATKLARYTSLLDHHVWVEVEVQGAWIAIDPIFNTGPAPSPVEVLQRDIELWDDLSAKITIEFEATLADGQKKVFGEHRGPLSSVAYDHVSLVFEPDVRLEHAIRPVVSVAGQTKVGEYLPRNEIKEIEVRVHTRRGRIESRYKESLVSQFDSRPVFSYDQAYFGISFFPGQVPSGFSREAARLGLDSGLDSIQALSTAKVQEPATQIEPFLNRVHAGLPHAISAAYVAHADRLIEELAFSMGTHVLHLEPRVVITAVLRKGGDYAFRMHLHQPGLDAIPRKGVPAAASTGLLTLVGHMEADLESQVLQRLLTKPLLTAGELFSRAESQGVPLMTVERGNLNRVSQLNLNRERANLIREHVSRQGQLVLIPRRDVEVDGRARRGWWALQPSTGLITGSMGGGLLGAAVEDSGTTTVGPSALELMKRILVLGDTTEDVGAHLGLVCKARTDVIKLMSAFCATSEPISLPDVNSCLNQPAHVDSLVGKCLERTQGVRCGTSVASALLTGELTAMYSEEETKNARRRHKGKAFGLSCQ